MGMRDGEGGGMGGIIRPPSEAARETCFRRNGSELLETMLMSKMKERNARDAMQPKNKWKIRGRRRPPRRPRNEMNASREEANVVVEEHTECAM